MAAQKQALSDLTAINGIKSARQDWFRDAFNVRSYADLAALSAQAIESRARDDGHRIGRSDIEQILADVRRRVGLPLPSAGAMAGADAGSPEGANGVRKAESPGGETWVEAANFVITFERRNADANGRIARRITAHKMQEGGISAEWTGLQQEPMCDWIAHHVGDWGDEPNAAAASEPTGPTSTLHSAALAGPADPEVASLHLAALDPRGEVASQAVVEPSPVPSAASGTTVRISRLNVVRSATLVPQSSVAGAVEAGDDGRMAFDLLAHLQFGEGGVGDASDPAMPACPIEFFGRNLATAQKMRLGEAQAPANQRGRCVAVTLSNVELPPGTYRLACVARLTNSNAPPASLRGPLLVVS
jgi:hypothetical protein